MFPGFIQLVANNGVAISEQVNPNLMGAAGKNFHFQQSIVFIFGQHFEISKSFFTDEIGFPFLLSRMSGEESGFGIWAANGKIYFAPVALFHRD